MPIEFQVPAPEAPQMDDAEKGGDKSADKIDPDQATADFMKGFNGAKKPGKCSLLNFGASIACCSGISNR